ncbi:MAG TPA: hypothetical protein VME66_01405 [Candidatus Acidoferrales bacterium]|nr:hypothetical protein [Candidatus Acidoferrales bacterium]
MPSHTARLDARSAASPEAHDDLQNAELLGSIGEAGGFEVGLLRSGRHLRLVVSAQHTPLLAIRLSPENGEVSNVALSERPDGTRVLEYTTAVGAMRAKVALRNEGFPALHWTISLVAAEPTALAYWPRDLHLLTESGKIHTSQRGLRSGVLFASTQEPQPFSFFYFQNFSSLNEYFEETKTPPANSVGGRFPDLGYAPPSGEDRFLPKAREIAVSDAYLLLSQAVPETNAAAAGQYLDFLCELYLQLPRPDVDYRHWPERARKALRDLSLSPACTYTRQGRRYLMPYVGDTTKPPESMVQFTLAVNTMEYDQARETSSTLTRTLRDSVASFFEPKVGAVVRWLPGEPFGDSQADDNMNHGAMDSWYLHHSLFNLCRLAAQGDTTARELFAKSLPYVIRVAHRFDYRWPIFFDLESLDIIRAEAQPGSGGETDVAGLYALVMIHAYEAFGDQTYLREACAAAARLENLGFDLAYQLNTTGFAAEAMMRLWKLTHDPTYLGLSEICMANLFDNMWLWSCEYGDSRHCRTFFGLFPLRDAPYLAPYEETEAVAKFHEYLRLGAEDVRPSLRLLIAEYLKYALDRGWCYYPDASPLSNIAPQSRNGIIDRTLCIPVEDLRDGFAPSGSVGQEIYGAGMPFVFTTRHYRVLPGGRLLAYGNYPLDDFAADEDGTAVWRVGGDPRIGCEIRIIPTDSELPPTGVTASVQAGEVGVPLHGELTTQGHARFLIRGGQRVTITWGPPRKEHSRKEIVIGALCASTP